MLKDFKAFAFKGNLIDMSVGIIIGGAFATVVKSLVDNLFMPPLGLLMGQVDFKAMKLVLVEAVSENGKVVRPEVAVGYGQFITDLVAFLLLAMAVFILVKKVIESMKREPEPAPAPAPEVPKQELLLAEIRDLLKTPKP